METAGGTATISSLLVACNSHSREGIVQRREWALGGLQRNKGDDDDDDDWTT